MLTISVSPLIGFTILCLHLLRYNIQLLNTHLNREFIQKVGLPALMGIIPQAYNMKIT